MIKMTDARNYDDDSVFVAALEDCTLPKEHFNHRGHLRLAYLYLRDYGFTEAMNRIRTTIRTYATSLGAADKYHETITALFMSLISARMTAKDMGWQSFIDANPDLSNKNIISQYLTDDVLADPRAKTEIVFPPRLASAA